MHWYQHGKATGAEPDRGIRELQKMLGEALVALNASENQLVMCIERVKETRKGIEHDELVLDEVIERLTEVVGNKVIRAREFDVLRKSLQDIRRALTQRRVNLAAARDAVDKTEDERDALTKKVASLRGRIEKYQTIIPMKRKST